MSKDRLWIFGGIALMLVIVVGGWLVGISPQLDQVSSVSAQTTTIQTANAKSTTDLANLRTQFAHIGTFRSALNKLRGSIPESAGASAFLNELTVLAAANGVTLTDVEVGSATLYAAPEAAVAPPAATSSDSSDSSSTPAPTTPVPATAPTQSVGGGLVLVPVTISAKGPFDSIRDFLGAVQKGTRLYFASSASMSVDSTGSTTGTLTGDAFTLQGTSDVVTKTTLIPTPTATVTPTATPTPTPTNSTATTTTKTGSSTATSTAPSTVPTTTPSPSDSASTGP